MRHTPGRSINYLRVSFIDEADICIAMTTLLITYTNTRGSKTISGKEWNVPPAFPPPRYTMSVSKLQLGASDGASLAPL